MRWTPPENEVVAAVSVCAPIAVASVLPVTATPLEQPLDAISTAAFRIPARRRTPGTTVEAVSSVTFTAS